MKKYILLMVTIMGMLIFTGCSNDIMQMEIPNADKIKIGSGSTGKLAEIVDEEDVQYIVDNITSLEYKKDKSSENYDGFGYSLQFYNSNATIESIIIMGKTRVSYNGYFYDILNGNIDTEFLEEQLTKTARKDAYINALKKLYYDYKLPDGTKLDYEQVEFSEYYDMTQNQFALYDFDFDGSDELIIALTNPPMAEMVAIIYDFDSSANTLKEKFVAFPSINFYDNGVVEALWSHNQGLAGDALWPYTMCQYNKESDSYDMIAIVDAWDKSLKDTDYEGNSFPEEIDKDGDGIIYYIMYDGKYELNTPVDLAEYDKWRSLYITDETVKIDIAYMNLTEENINSIK